MANGNMWTKDEIQFLKENYLTLTQKQIAEKLGRTRSSVNIKASKLGLKKELYTCDYEFFKEIDTEEKAYWLGFIYADGYVTLGKDGSGTLGIELQKNDINHLKKFNISLKGNYKIIERTRVCNLNNKEYEMCGIRIYSKPMALDLINHGVMQNKSKKIILPELDPILIRHFIRGFFDGDGCVTKCTKKDKNKTYVNIRFDFTCASEEFINQLRVILINNGIFTYIAKEKDKPYRLCIAGKENGTKFYNYLYEGSNINLERKIKKSRALIEELQQ